ncbi:Rabaptin-5 [Carabus blaptoides fortunei]
MEVQNMKDSNSEEQHKLDKMNKRIEELEAENKKIRDEFNVQRAKMKDLFLQKEEEFNNERSRIVSDMQKMKEELDEARSQLLIAGMKLETDLEDEKRKAHEEIASLQQLVHETVEESSSSRSLYDTELRKLQLLIQQLQEENKELKSIGQQSSPHHIVQEPTSLAPSVMLSAMTKTLARKLGADTFSSQDSLEESMRKAQEDAEMLRSLVIPLEEEIKALKDKLRATDDQLQRCIQCGHNTDAVESCTMETQDQSSTTHDDVAMSNSGKGDGSGTGDAESPAPCDMCCNYETQLVREQQRNAEIEARLSAAEKGMERHKEDLLKEIGFRKDMEDKWNEKREEHKLQVSELNKRTLCAEQDLQELRKTYQDYCTEIMDQLSSLTREREQVYERLGSLQRENDYLVGKYSAHSQQLQNEAINLPDTIEELQEKLLKLQEEMIVAHVGKEAAQEQGQTLQGDIALLRDQLSEREKIQQELTMHMEQMKKQNQMLDGERRHLIASNETYKVNEVKFEEQQRVIKNLEDHNAELKSRVASLQQELDNSEAVQKDFVRLSQSLQVQLEKIRASDAQVRWQFDEDCDECPNCRGTFSGSRKKHHCLHCGQIFCAGCLNRVVPSGPHRRPARVCDVCHTLLVKSSAPYFSTEAPHSPD